MSSHSLCGLYYSGYHVRLFLAQEVGDDDEVVRLERRKQCRIPMGTNRQLRQLLNRFMAGEIRGLLLSI